MAYPKYIKELEALKMKLTDVILKYQQFEDIPQMTVGEAKDLMQQRETVIASLKTAARYENL